MNILIFHIFLKFFHIFKFFRFFWISIFFWIGTYLLLLLTIIASCITTPCISRSLSLSLSSFLWNAWVVEGSFSRGYIQARLITRERISASCRLCCWYCCWCFSSASLSRVDSTLIILFYLYKQCKIIEWIKCRTILIRILESFHFEFKNDTLLLVQCNIIVTMN